jgi:superfamily II DNA or RNA helicase
MGDAGHDADGVRAGWRAPSVWARTETFDANPVTQLVAPESVFDQVVGERGQLEVRNHYGAWPASTPESPLGQDRLWVKVPIGTRPHSSLRNASWMRPSTVERAGPETVLESYRDSISFTASEPDAPGLRSPQLGALHAILGYWTTKRAEPATVVMPTGTGKTETMLALLAAARPKCLLVLVPSDSLREQVASKFETLGVLQELGILSPSALRPNVGRVRHRFTEADTATNFAEMCNVIVATPPALDACEPDALRALIGVCSHLFIDEAHHVAARTWSNIRQLFGAKPVVQFTATPFREDGKHLQGRSIYSFPLREAQSQGYFSAIDYKSVIDFDDIDRAIAIQSVKRLRADLAAGYDHVLMARVGSVKRAKEVLPLYEEIAQDLSPAIINSGMSKGSQGVALQDLRGRKSRIIVCVNMLGEGFDLPALKVGALHDPQKSLGVSLQFIGRFARTSSNGNFGGASMFVARKEIEVDKRLRELYAEDSDWNVILRNLTEAAVDEQQDISDFEDGFTGQPQEVALRSLLPKLSTVVYRARSSDWEPDNITDFFGAENLLTSPIGLNNQAGVAWCVVEHRQDVRWGDLKTLEEVSYQLYVLYFDRDRRLLYINNSANDGVFEKLAEAVIGPGAERFTGSTVYRSMADIDRLVPTTVGVLDVHDQFRRFSMHVGSDVTASFSQAEASTKSQTNISGSGFREGERVSVSASLKGRIWSYAAASSLKMWCDWCDTIGEKLLDDSISIEKVIGQFILPERIKSRPPGVLLAVEWPWQLHLLQPESVRLSHGEKVYEAVYTDLVPKGFSETGPFEFAVKTEAWEVGYEAGIERGRLRYRSTSADEVRVLRKGFDRPLSDWLNANMPTLILDGDRIIEGDLLYKPTWDRAPFDRTRLTALEWGNTDFKVESQTKEKLTHSIQFRAIAELLAGSSGWDVVLDDDGSGEIADLVAMRIDNDSLVIRLVHCKYSHGETAGARVADLYEVCGQAQKSVIWRRSDLLPFFKALDRRARQKQKREGVSPFEVGDISKLYTIRDQARVLRRRLEIVIAQPGLSVSNASDQQLDLLSSTQAYLMTTVKAPLTVWCSA